MHSKLQLGNPKRRYARYRHGRAGGEEPIREEVGEVVL
jgi:hypothetical protein